MSIHIKQSLLCPVPWPGFPQAKTVQSILCGGHLECDDFKLITLHSLFGEQFNGDMERFAIP